MKKTFTKVLSVLLCVALLLGATSVSAFAADSGSSENLGNIVDALGDWVDALANYEWNDFFGFVTAILGLFGFEGSFEGVHSIPALMDEWFGWLGDYGQIYEAIINFIDTDQLVSFINTVLSGGKN